MGFSFKKAEAPKLEPPSLPQAVAAVAPTDPQSLLGNAGVQERLADPATVEAPSPLPALPSGLGPTLDKAAGGKAKAPPKKKGGGKPRGNTPSGQTAPNPAVAALCGDVEARAADLRGHADGFAARGPAEAAALQRMATAALSCVSSARGNGGRSDPSALVQIVTAVYQLVAKAVDLCGMGLDTVRLHLGHVATATNLLVQAAAMVVDDQLGTALPLIISFLGSFLGLGGVSDKVGDAVGAVVDKVDDTVEGAADEVFGWLT